MRILAIEKESLGLKAEDFRPHAKSEAARVWELYQAGAIREMYYREDRSEAVLMLECADVDEANQILHTLPLVQQGLITFDVIPLKPYPGFVRLFAKET